MGWQDAPLADDNATPQQPAWMSAPEVPPVDLEPPSAIVRLGRGMMDVYQGAKQKYLNWTDPAAAAAYTKEVDADLALYEQARGKDAGFDWMRLAGSVATPLAVIPGGPASVVGRLVAGAAVGGATGYVVFNPDNTPASNAVRTGVGAVGGAILNVAIPPAIQAASTKVNQLWRLGMQRISPAVQSGIQSEVGQTLASKGIDLNKLPDAVRQSLVDDAAEQLAKQGTFDAAQLTRKADIEAVAGAGMGTKAQISRDPQQWTIERNLQKSEVNLPAVQRGESGTLTERFQAQDVAAKEYAAALETKISGVPAAQRAQTPLQASEKTISAIQKADKEAEAAVGELYTAYRAMGVERTPVPGTGIAQTLGQVVDDFGVENVPAAVLSRLKEFGFLEGKPAKPFTIQEADKLGRLINNNNPGFGPTSKALALIKTAVNESLLEVPVEGGAGVQALLQARAAAAERFAAQRTTKAIQQAIKDVPPDRFFESSILRGNVRDIQKLGERLKTIPDGDFAWNDLRTQTWQWIVNKASQDGRAPINGVRLANAIKNVGPDRMKALFTKAEMTDIETMQRGTLAMTHEPAYAAPNRSNTSQSLLGQVLRFANKIPMLNITTDPIERQVQTAVQQKALTESLAGKMTPAPQVRALSDLTQAARPLVPLPAEAFNLLQQRGRRGQYVLPNGMRVTVAP